MKTMIKPTSVLLVAVMFCCCNTAKITTNAQPNSLTGKQKQEGWQLLFDGMHTSGWHSYGLSNVAASWTIADNALHGDPSAKKDAAVTWSNDLVTDDEYKNFDFKADWKIAKNGNSGIIFYVHEDKDRYKNTYETGPEMQVIDNAGHPDGKIIKHHAGDLYDLISSSTEPVKPVGEWNHAEIIANNGKLDFYLNGQHIVSTTMWDDNWKQMVANSKFKSMPAFGTFKQGHIALQMHGDEVWYRNIMIKKL